MKEYHSFIVKSPLFVRRAMSTHGMNGLLPAEIVCVGKEVFHIVGFSTDGRVAFRRKIRRLAVADPSSPLEYGTSDWTISMSSPGTDIEGQIDALHLECRDPNPHWRLTTTFWRAIPIEGGRRLMPSVVAIR